MFFTQAINYKQIKLQTTHKKLRLELPWASCQIQIRKITLVMPGTFSPPPTSKDARNVMHVGIANPRWQLKLSRHSRRMHNPQVYVRGKSPIAASQLAAFVSDITAIHGPVLLTLFIGDMAWVITPIILSGGIITHPCPKLNIDLAISLSVKGGISLDSGELTRRHVYSYVNGLTWTKTTLYNCLRLEWLWTTTV